MRRQAALPFAALVALSACDAQPPEQNRDHQANENNRAKTANAADIIPLGNFSSTYLAQEESPRSPAPIALKTTAPVDQTETVKLAYQHQIILENSAGSLKNRFERARRDCLNQVKGCLLISATIDGGDTKRPEASLTLRLPHAAVEPFKAALLAPLDGEGAGGATIRRISTEAQDLTQTLADTDRRTAQLKAFRDSLLALAQRKDAKVEDLITVQDKLSETQTMLEEIAANHDQLIKRVDTELVTIRFVTAQSLDVAIDPISLVWRNAATTISASTAKILQTSLASLPYLVIIAPFGGLAALLLRRRRSYTKTR